ncbi:MAG: CDP-diacylglycerol--serine O-phosphatidyltransferase [Bacillota bacterium]
MKQAVNDYDTIVKYKYNYANVITLLNLTMGCFSLFFVLESKPFLAASFIIIAALLDRFDGTLARKSGMVTDLGKELDSLSDLVSFGVAPAMLLWFLALNNIFIYGKIIAVIYILAGAFRLARFNVTEFKGFYIGVPITIAGGLLAIAAIITIKQNTSPYLLAGFSLFLSYAMVSSKIKLAKK